jgi:hypothetical protein
MSVYDLPFCDVCGMPYKDGLPTCDCESRLAQDDRDDEAVVAQICSKLKSNCS